MSVEAGEQGLRDRLEKIVEHARTKTPCGEHYQCLLADLGDALSAAPPPPLTKGSGAALEALLNQPEPNVIVQPDGSCVPVSDYERGVLDEHRSHVDFENELYATLVDPVADGPIKEAEMRKQ